MKRNKGITLIALIITIIVMLILVGITINVVLNSNILGSAKNAGKKWKDEAQKEAGNMTITMDGVEYASIEDYIQGNRIYDPEGWEMAWTCADGGEWSSTINKGETAEGDMVAKLYKTGNKITPSNSYFTGEEGDEYHLVIEGIGIMGNLMTKDEYDNVTARGWQESTGMLYEGSSDTCIMMYVSKVIVGEGIKNIGAGAFDTGTELNNVILPNSITSIGKGAFTGCTSLVSITIPSSVTSIGEEAFLCSSLTSITIPDSVTSIGDSAFNQCTSLASITIPNSVTSIGVGTFRLCSSLTSITIPNTVTSIGVVAFQQCYSLASITIPNSVTSIGSSAFNQCTSLASITIPSSVTSIEMGAFSTCTSLAKVKVLSADATIGTTIKAFSGLAPNSKIYVLNDTMKTRVEAALKGSTTVEVVTEEEMNSL